MINIVIPMAGKGQRFLEKGIKTPKPLIQINSIDKKYFENLENAFPRQLLYKLWLIITQDANFGAIQRTLISDISKFQTKSKSEIKRLQQKETIKRYQFINSVLKKGLQIDKASATDFRSKLDRDFGYFVIQSYSNFARVVSYKLKLGKSI